MGLPWALAGERGDSPCEAVLNLRQERSGLSKESFLLDAHRGVWILYGGALFCSDALRDIISVPGSKFMI